MPDHRPARPKLKRRFVEVQSGFDAPCEYEREHKSAANWVNDIMVEARDG